MSDTIFHCLRAKQFSYKLLQELFLIADKVRYINKTKKGALFLESILPHKKGMLYFVQPSTRTYLSFKAAFQILGIKASDVRDERTSSSVKGESQSDTIRTFSSYSDFIVMRHPKSGVAEKASEILDSSDRPIPVINAGSGQDEHPTQALLDIYTIHRSFYFLKTKLENKVVVFCGDLLRGRTVRSLCQILPLYKKIKIIFVAPKEFQIKNDILEILNSLNVSYELRHSLKQSLPQADVLYMTRIQDEYDNKNFKSSNISVKKYYLSYKDLSLMKEKSLIMHPLPRRMEIDSLVDKDSRCQYWRQERNGMWIRAALLIKIFKKVDEVFSYNS